MQKLIMKIRYFLKIDKTDKNSVIKKYLEKSK